MAKQRCTDKTKWMEHGERNGRRIYYARTSRCKRPAVVTLVENPAFWVDIVGRELTGQVLHLCAEHAETMRTNFGWIAQEASVTP